MGGKHHEPGETRVETALFYFFSALCIAASLMVAGVVVLALGLVGWPRLKSTAIHYELIRLRADVGELEQHERELRLELERERSPERLAIRARELGMVPAAPAGEAAPPLPGVAP